jgi:hypothetical protein
MFKLIPVTTVVLKFVLCLISVICSATTNVLRDSSGNVMFSLASMYFSASVGDLTRLLFAVGVFP